MEDANAYHYTYLQKDRVRCIVYGLLIGTMYALLTWQNHRTPTTPVVLTYGILGGLYASLCWRVPSIGIVLTGTVLLTSFTYRFQEGAWSHDIAVAFYWLLVPLATPLCLFVLSPVYDRHLSNWGESESPPYRRQEEK